MEKKPYYVIGAVFFVLLALYFFTSGKSPKIKDLKLVVMITVDQFADEYLDRYQPHFRGGLKKLTENGRVYRKVLHGHAYTATCPGHASIVTGTDPKEHGIVSNYWYERSSRAREYCIGEDLSPENMRRTGIPDWFQDRYPNGKVFSVSGKDRAAVLMGGMKPDAVYWYDRSTGKMATSGYYSKRGLPWWIEAFNKEKASNSYFGKLWRPKYETSIEPAEIGNEDFNHGDFPHEFPHAMGSAVVAPHKAFYNGFFHSPFLDEMTLEFVKQLMVHHELGRDGDPDYLSISLSALDTVGHNYGPHSREVMDTLLRVDELLGKFFYHLEQEIGLEHVLIVFTSDHGIGDFPEYRKKKGMEASRIKANDISCIQKASLSDRYPGGVFEAPGYLKKNYLTNEGAPKTEIFKQVRARLVQCEPVREVWTSSELTWPAQEDEYLKKMQQRYARNYYSGRSPDIFILPKPHYSFMPNYGVNHGSPHDYDAEVPLIFMNPQIAKGVSADDTVRYVTQIAPTLSSLLGLSPDSKLSSSEMLLELR